MRNYITMSQQLYYRVNDVVHLPITRKQLYRLFDYSPSIINLYNHLDLNEILWHYIIALNYRAVNLCDGRIYGPGTRLYSRWITYMAIRIQYNIDNTIKLPNLLIEPDYNYWCAKKFLVCGVSTRKTDYRNIALYNVASIKIE